jgi:hypothetical protein
LILFQSFQENGSPFCMSGAPNSANFTISHAISICDVLNRACRAKFHRSACKNGGVRRTKVRIPGLAKMLDELAAPAGRLMPRWDCPLMIRAFCA